MSKNASLDTIFAPLTIFGKCSIFVIRISGPRVVDCLRSLGVKKKLIHRQASLCNLLDKNNRVIDEALVLYFKGPNSFTGEDVCELNLHCSKFIIRKVITILSELENVRLATNGEFSKRAFLNNKIDLTQAEAIVNLIEAETEEQNKLAIRQLKGENSKFFEELRQDVLHILSGIEAMIDFPEDEPNETLIDDLRSKIDNIIDVIKRNLNDNRASEIVKKGIDISIIGEPNVGKSSLLNVLAKDDISIVSDTPGTTRDVVRVSLDINGFYVTISDTAGIRETKDAIEAEGIKRTFKNLNEATIRLLVLDARQKYTNEIVKDVLGPNTIVVINKIDLASESNISYLEKEFEKYKVVKISALKNQNIDILLNAIKDFLQKNITPYLDTNITNERSRLDLIEAMNSLSKVDFNLPIEINAEFIRLAAFAIGKITGIINTEEILDNIFSHFCIGK